MTLIALHFIRAFLAAAVGWWVCRRFGLLPALALGLVCGFVFSAAGYAALLQTSVGEISWKNHLAGWLMPWGYLISPHRLIIVAAISMLVWTCCFGMGAIASTKTGTGQNAFGSEWTSVWLAMSWIILGSAILFLLNRWSQIGNPTNSTTLLIAMAVIGGIMTTSVTLRIFGNATVALWVATIPILAVILLFGVMASAILISGTSSRWN